MTKHVWKERKKKMTFFFLGMRYIEKITFTIHEHVLGYLISNKSLVGEKSKVLTEKINTRANKLDAGSDYTRGTKVDKLPVYTIVSNVG